MEYLNRELDISSYEEPRDFHRDYIAINLLSKFDSFDLGVDRVKVALDKFLLSEQLCKEANLRLALFDVTCFKMQDTLPSIVHDARGKIERLLSTFSWDQALPFMGFGPGATIGLPRKKSDVYYKFGLVNPTTTGENAILASCAIAQFPQWLNIVTQNSGLSALDNLKIVRGNRITTVPKNAKCDRVIAIEPLMNMFVQKGIGGLIRRALMKVGVNLNDQTRNQLLAKAGSQHGHLATLDLSMASDCLSLRLVELLLPPDWVTAIKICRSSVGVLPDGTEIRYQKVSSMGNGYTFELESLIFWALSSAVVSNLHERQHDIAVFGDDIIVPVSCYGRLVEVLEFVGFKTNKSKSFSEGPFRESCGKHYFLGRDVTPLYVKERVACLERKFWLANSFRRLAHLFLGYDYGCCASLQAAYEFVVSTLPVKHQRPLIPYDFGDGALIGDFDEVVPKRLGSNLDGFRVRYTRRVYKTFRGGELPMLVKSLWALHSRKVGSGIAPEVEPSVIPTQRFVLRLVKGQVQRWGNLGPWLSGFNP
jgi:hypothetical protein